MPCLMTRGYAHGMVSLVIRDGLPKFETHEFQDSKKSKWLSKKRLKMKRMREKMKRREANRRDPRRLRPKGPGMGTPRFATAEERLKYKIQKAKIKEALLLEKLEAYDVLKVQGPMVKPEILTGEERFYMKKMAQKHSNYVPVGRRGVFGGVILNMHLHWKKHETVKVICKPCKPGQAHEYAREIARLSGGVPIQVIGDDTIIFYRGRNYVRPEVMSPVDTLSKKRALEKSKYEQSLETVRNFIAMSEKELELYYQHMSLYGNPSSRLLDNSASYVQKKSSGLDVKDDAGVVSADIVHKDHHNDPVQFDHEVPIEISIYSGTEESEEVINSDFGASKEKSIWVFKNVWVTLSQYVGTSARTLKSIVIMEKVRHIQMDLSNNHFVKILKER